MQKTFTPEDLIRYFYNETSEKENHEIEAELAVNSELNISYQAIMQTLEVLDQLLVSPSSACIDTILDYSNKTSPMEEVH